MRDETKKEWKAYNDIYRNIFHILGFHDSQRELCHKLSVQCINEIIKAKRNKINYKEVLKEAYK